MASLIESNNQTPASGKFFGTTLVILTVVELLSLIGYLIPTVGQVVFWLILMATLIAALTKLEYGLSILLAELFVGSKGYLFAANLFNVTISIRLALFLIVMATWLWWRIKNHDYKIIRGKIILNYLALFCFIGLGLVLGIINNNLGNVFFDFNAWVYFALIFVFIDVAQTEFKKKVLVILAAATTLLSLKTVLILTVFSRGLDLIGGPLYKWIRDTGVGEITYVSGTIFRVFFQSQIYILIGFLVFLTILLTKKFSGKVKILIGVYLYCTSLAIIISQSRSFWLGGLTALAGLMILLWWKFGFRFKKTSLLILILGLTLISQIFLIQIITGNFSGNPVASRFKDLQGDPGGNSRLNQLRPLADSIFQRIIIGYGFGKELTYISSDPRILKNHPGGVYTTYAFEWGYLDIWLKIGLLGLIAYLVLIVRIAKDLWQKKGAPFFGLLLGLIALLVTNIFSPYLNHPLGIGYLLLISTILPVI